MNWTAWNSLWANALTKSPSATPSSALTQRQRHQQRRDRAVSRPSGPSVTAASTAVCTSATSANAMP